MQLFPDCCHRTSFSLTEWSKYFYFLLLPSTLIVIHTEEHSSLVLWTPLQWDIITKITSFFISISFQDRISTSVTQVPVQAQAINIISWYVCDIHIRKTECHTEVPIIFTYIESLGQFVYKCHLTNHKNIFERNSPKIPKSTYCNRKVHSYTKTCRYKEKMKNEIHLPHSFESLS